jgi:hypothetical protein
MNVDLVKSESCEILPSPAHYGQNKIAQLFDCAEGIIAITAEW